MDRPRRSKPRSVLVFLGFLLSVVCAGGLVGTAGCGESDPLAAVRAQQNAGDYEGSLEPLRELLAERPNDAEVQYLYGRALSLVGQVSHAEWSLREAMKDPKWLVPAGMQLAYDALRSGSYSATVEAAGRVLEVEPDNVSALLLRANGHAFARGHEDWEKALADVDRVLELDPGNLDAMKPRILALLSLDRPEEAGEAIDALGKEIEENQLGPEMEGWHCATRATFADESGETEQAEERFEDCLERFPAHANVVSDAVHFFDSRGDYERSLEILKKALEEVPESRDYRSAVAQRLRAMGRPKEAEELLRKATETDRPFFAIAAWLELAEHYQSLYDFDAGVDAAEHAMEIAKKTGFSHPQLLLEYADALLVAGKLDRARAVAEEMTLPAHRELVLARVDQESGRFQEALAHYDEALRFWPDHAPARYEAARTAAAAGDFQRAIDEFRYAIRIAPEATDARTQLALLYAAERNPSAALGALNVRPNTPLELEGRLEALRLWAWVGNGDAVRASFARFQSAPTAVRTRALVSAAEGLRQRSGPEAAMKVLRGAPDLDLTDPQNAVALRTLVRLAHEAGKPEEAEAALKSALAAHPEVAAFHEAQGLALELRGAPGEEVQAAYRRALELEPDLAPALAGLGREALPRDPTEALALFDRAIAADSSDIEAQRGAGRALVATGRPEEAEKRLNALLASHPYEGGPAADLVELQLARGPVGDETVKLARRAVRFGGGAPALDLLSRVYAQQGDAESASQAAEAARTLREKTAPGA